MKIILTGACGFAGSTIASGLVASSYGVEIIGVDNLSRPGSELNRLLLRRMGIELRHLDVRSASDIGTLGPADWIIDAAANPAVLAGVDGCASSRQLVEHNLLGTINLLEYCKAHQAGFILLSTSRVYSVSALAAIRTKLVRPRYQLVPQKLRGLSMQGVSEEFSTEPPLSLYGAAKRASEQLAIEYGSAFDFPVWINRCGVLAGAGQFGKADQGVFSFWVHSYRWRKPLRYIGFDGEGHQVRDCLHPRDLISVLINQIRGAKGPVVCNFGGGLANSMSLRELSNWCAKRFGSHKVAHDRRRRPFDIRWLVLDCSRARNHWDWQPQTSIEDVLEEIALHAETRPDWLEITR